MSEARAQGRKRGRALALAFSLITFPSCTPPDDDLPSDSTASDAAVAVRFDSAGTSIVETPAEALTTLPLWEVAGAPLVAVGTSSDPDHHFFQVTGAQIHEDGTFTVSDRGSQSLRTYDESGTLLSTFGREGQGPGEFMGPTLVPYASSDTMLAWDAGSRRAYRISLTDGGFLSSSPEEWSGRTAPVGGVGATVLRRDRVIRTPEAEGPQAEPVSFRWQQVDGTTQTPIVRFEQPRWFALRSGGTPFVVSYPFAAVPSAAVGRAAAYIAEGPDLEIQVHPVAAVDAAPSLLRVRDYGRTPVEEGDVDAYWLSQFPDGVPSDGVAARFTSELVFPERFPAVKGLLVDPMECLWIELDGSGAEPTHWLVADHTLEFRARATLPPDTEVLDVGGDRVLGLRRDALGVEEIVVFALERDQTGRGGSCVPGEQVTVE